MHKPKFKRRLAVLLLFLMTFFQFSFGNISYVFAGTGITTLGDSPVAWPTTWYPYAKSDGTPITDAGENLNPPENDLVSGAGNNATGTKPSVYITSDAQHQNVFFRFRVLGDPTSSQGGSTSAYVVNLGINGAIKAAVGVNNNYVYVCQPGPTNLNYIYTFDLKTLPLPSVQAFKVSQTADSTGEYFVDFQVPISRITEACPEITASTPIQIFFGSSAANSLGVINKDWMTGSGSVNFTGLAKVQLNDVQNSMYPTVTISGGESVNTSSVTPVISGTTTAPNGSDVSVSVNGTSYNTTVSNGSWSANITNALPTGSYTVTARVNSAVDTQTLNITPSLYVSITNPLNGITTNDATPTITGKTLAGQVVHIFINGVDVGTSTADGSGNWNYTTNTLIDGSYSVSASTTDNSNNTVNSSTIAFTVNTSVADVTPPVVSLSSPLNGAVVNVNTVNISGSTEPGLPVHVFVDGSEKAIVTADGSGNWNYTAASLGEGSHSIKAETYDEAGNKGTSSTSVITVDTVSPNITLTSPLNGADISSKSISISGKTEPGLTVKVIMDGNLLGTTTADISGNWSYPVSNLSDGNHSFRGETVDGAGNTGVSSTSTVNIDTSAPNISIASPINGFRTENKSVTITGTTEPGLLVNVYIDNVLVGTVTADGSGNWSFGTSTLLQGNHTLKASTQDKAGNVGTSSSILFTINTPPTASDYTKYTISGEAVSGKVEGQDTSDDSLAYSIASAPVHGTAEVDEAGNWIYAPTNGYYGIDSFNVKVLDSRGDYVNSKITVEVFKDKLDVKGVIKDQQTDNVIPGAKITLSDDDGNVLYTTTADSNGNYIISNVPLGTYIITSSKDKYASESTELNVQGNEPTDSSITQDIFLGNFYTNLEASPSSIVGDGNSTSTLTTTVLDKDKNPISGAQVTFVAASGSFPSGNTAVTDKYGKASVVYKSEAIGGVTSTVSYVRAIVNDEVHGLYGESQISITFTPASIQGVIVDNTTGLAVGGAVVEVSKDFDGDGTVDFYSKFVTQSDGVYKIAIPKGNLDYDVAVTRPVQVGDKVIQMTFHQNVHSGSVAGSGYETFVADNTATGVVLYKNSDGKSKLLNDYSKYDIGVFSDGSDFSGAEIAGVSANIVNSGSGKGVFSVNGLTRGKIYNFALRYAVTDTQKIVVGTMKVNMDTNGQLNIIQSLIDPYGDIKDSKTGAAISGVLVRLYYADTERNRKAGIKPNTLVSLPAIAGFEPNDNANPQYSDSLGKYAMMVFPNTDYYLVAQKDGYNEYRSDTISVNLTIVRHDISLVKASTLAILPKTGAFVDSKVLEGLGLGFMILGGVVILMKKEK